MAEFDPDAYTATGFDPDAYVGEAKPASKQGPSPSRWSQKLGEGALPGFNRVSALLNAATDPLIPGRAAEWGPDFATRYAEHLRANQAQSSQTQQEHPYVSAGLQAAGALPSAAVAAPAGLAKTGAGLGAAYGIGDTRATEPVGMAMDAGAGALVGAAASQLPRVLLGGENLLRRGVSAVTPRLKATPEAALLEAQGVPLTVGQKAPQSTIGILERMSSENPLGMGPQRHEAEQAFMRAAQDKGAAPGTTPPTNKDLQGRLGELFKGYEAAYAKFQGKPVEPSVLRELPKAAEMPGQGVSAKTAKGVKSEVEDALSILGSEPTQASVGDLLKVRSHIRQETMAARQAQDFDRLKMLSGAEDTVTGAIESALDPAERAALQATDRQYARLMTAAKAAPAGQTEFTPGQYLRQVEKAAGRRLFKTGGAGDLQDLGEAARKTFANAPLTGFRPGVLSAIPGAKYFSAPLSRAANTPGGQELLFQGLKPLTYTPVGGYSQGPTSGISMSMAERLAAALRGIHMKAATAEDANQP